MRFMPEHEHETARAKLTYDDFVHFPEDGLRHELIDGAHCVTPAPLTRHQEISMQLSLLIATWLDAHPIGHLFHAPTDIVLSRHDVVEPDLLYVSAARAHEVLEPKHLIGAPELVVEITSPGTRRQDEGSKHRLYERTGVMEYWIVDPDSATVRVWRSTGGRFGAPIDLSRAAGDVLRTPLLGGLELPLDRIFKSRLPR
jgi:Uma2 family endonuclease